MSRLVAALLHKVSINYAMLSEKVVDIAAFKINQQITNAVKSS